MTMCERVVEYFGEKVRKMKLGWFGYVQRRDSGYIGRRMWNLELSGRRKKEKEKFHRCSEGAKAEGWCYRDSLKGPAERGKRKSVKPFNDFFIVCFYVPPTIVFCSVASVSLWHHL